METTNKRIVSITLRCRGWVRDDKLLETQKFEVFQSPYGVWGGSEYPERNLSSIPDNRVSITLRCMGVGQR